jgi:crotonobetainyl-CoA:carnitine CoA-transferase CaiB-like acyl-CoA transferase
MDEQQNTGTLLGGYRVLDLTNERGMYCGKLLADLGADVIKIEKPGGDPCRNIGPFYHDIPDPNKSLYWFHFNTSKRSITLDIEKRDGQELFKRLVAVADFVLESFSPGYLANLGLGYGDLEKINPRVIVVSITPFGQTGPYRDYKASDIVTMAMGGLMYLCGDADRPPVRVTAAQSYMQAALQGAAGAMIANLHRVATGEGQHVDVSMQECISDVLDTTQQAWDLQQIIYARQGGERFISNKPVQVPYPCKDGFFAAYNSPEDFEEILKWSKQTGVDLEEDPDTKEIIAIAREKIKESMATGVTRIQLFDIEQWKRYLALRAPFFKLLTKRELEVGARDRHFGWGVISTPKDLLESDQLETRNYFVPVEHPELQDTITYPGEPLKISETPWRISRRPPLIGEHNEEIYEKELGMTREEIILLRQTGAI